MNAPSVSWHKFRRQQNKCGARRVKVTLNIGLDTIWGWTSVSFKKAVSDYQIETTKRCRRRGCQIIENGGLIGFITHSVSSEDNASFDNPFGNRFFVTFDTNNDHECPNVDFLTLCPGFCQDLCFGTDCGLAFLHQWHWELRVYPSTHFDLTADGHKPVWSLLYIPHLSWQRPGESKDIP